MPPLCRIRRLLRGRILPPQPQPDDVSLAEEEDPDAVVEAPPVQERLEVGVVDAFDHAPRELSANKFKNLYSGKLRVFVVNDATIK